MNATPSQVVVQLIKDLGLTSDGWGVTSPFTPNDRDDLIVVTGTAGVYHGKDEDGLTYQNYGLQIRARGLPPASRIEAKLNAVYAALSTVKMRTVVVNGESLTVWGFHPVATPAYMGVEGNSRRENYVLNGTVTITS